MWGSPPHPPTPGAHADAGAGTAVDADQDSVSGGPPTATTRTRAIYPGAPEVAGDGLDQDCNGADAAGRLTAIVRSAAPAPQVDELESLQVTEAPAGATVPVTCSGKRKGCPKAETFTTSAKGSVSLTKMFRKRLRPAPWSPGGHGPEHGRPVKRSRSAATNVRVQTLCLLPGAPTTRRKC